MDYILYTFLYDVVKPIVFPKHNCVRFLNIYTRKIYTVGYRLPTLRKSMKDNKVKKLKGYLIVRLLI